MELQRSEEAVAESDMRLARYERTMIVEEQAMEMMEVMLREVFAEEAEANRANAETAAHGENEQSEANRSPEEWNV